MRLFLHGLSQFLLVIGGISFLFGGWLIYAAGRGDRFLGEILGIAVAFACLIGCLIVRYWIDDIEWKEANEDADSSADKTKP